MHSQSAPPSPAALLREADARMTQALGNFFQRSHVPLQDAVLRTIATQMTPSAMATGQRCLDWLNDGPEALSTAFAEQFQLHLAQPETFTQRHGSRPAELQLLDDDALKRQLAEDKAATQLTETLRGDMLQLFGRLQMMRRAAVDDIDRTDAYGPRPVVRALSRALDTLNIDLPCGTLLIQCATASLLETLKPAYTALNQFLCAQGISAPAVAQAVPSPRRTQSDVGQAILANIQSAAAHPGETGAAGTSAPAGGSPGMPRRLADSLDGWQTQLRNMPDIPPGPAAHIVQELLDTRDVGTRAFDRAILAAVTGLFEFILDDPAISPPYKAAIAQLQIPALRVALVAPEFFSDEQHPARQVIDLMGQFSRRFPEQTPSHRPAFEQIQTACAAIHHDPGHPVEAFAQAHSFLAARLAEENARAGAELLPEVARLEYIERQELGTLLALENLRDLTERYPAPESVLRRLEAAWVPHMASLYVAESGEGPDWRAACHTMLQLFLSLQSPDSDTMREARLNSIPPTNAALRRGLLAQKAEPAQLKDFFSAITATQECWIRPAVGQREAVVSRFTPYSVAREQIESHARQFADTPSDDPILQQAQQLREGDWVDFDPVYEGLTTACVAWVGVRDRLLFCGSACRRFFSLDRDLLVAELRAGRARIPEQSLTRKAMLALKASLSAKPY